MRLVTVDSIIQKLLIPVYCSVLGILMGESGEFQFV
jgi:hypothetical protein